MDFVFVLLFAGLAVATLLVTRSFTWAAVGLIFGFGVAGNLVQSSISLGLHWSVRGLQWFAVVVMVIVLAAGWRWGRRTAGIGEVITGSWRRQLLAIGLPMVAIGGYLVAMRLMAPGSPGPLSAVGYFVNHPLAEDNAKWLHLSAQLADGRDIAFNGYAGGPLLLLMSVMAALISVLSVLLLGGVNEVAVAANTVLATQFLLIALVPIALAPFAERRIPIVGRSSRVAMPLLWLAALVLFLASSVITSFGHLSLQFVLIVLVLWSTVFIAAVPGRARLLMTLAIATTASVWLPFNVLGLAVLGVAFVLMIMRRDWRGLGFVALTIVAVWDALISSTVFLLGIDLSAIGFGSGASSSGADSTDLGAGAVDLPEQVKTATSLFTAPGGVEQVQPVVAILAIACVLMAVWSVGRAIDGDRWARFIPFLPIAAFGTYVLLIQLGDAVTTGGAPHYGGHKLGFALAVMALVSTLPVAINGLEPRLTGMTTLRWFAIGGVIALLMLDTILPRALSALSPMLWPSVSKSAPQYWSAAEVKPTGSQPLNTLPIACMFAPPVADEPTALPLGQQSYACTRLMLGLSGMEDHSYPLVEWLQTDWMSNQRNWATFHDALVRYGEPFSGRTVLLMNADREVAGLMPYDALLARFAPVS